MVIPENNWFYFKHGRRASSIDELKTALEDIHEDEFRHHVTADKNDFATWIKDIFKDIELAEKLAGAKDKKHMQLVVYKHITHKLW